MRMDIRLITRRDMESWYKVLIQLYERQLCDDAV